VKKQRRSQRSNWSCEEVHGQIDAKVGRDDGLPCGEVGGREVARASRRPFSRTDEDRPPLEEKDADVMELSRPLLE